MQSRTSKSKKEPKPRPETKSKLETKPKQRTQGPSRSSVSAAKAAPMLAQPAASTPGPKKFDAVPLPEHGGHSHSYAAHLGSPMHAHTAPAFSFRQMPLREPPQQVSRIGKQHR